MSTFKETGVKHYIPLLLTVCEDIQKMEEEQFVVMFHGSPAYVGWRYFWRRYYTKKVGDRCFGSLYLNMDNKHQLLVAQYFMRFHPEIVDVKACKDAIHYWFLFAYNFPGDMWDKVFGTEKERFISMCGKPKKGFIPTITINMICKLFIKIPDALQLKLLHYAFFIYQDIDVKIKDRDEWGKVTEEMEATS